MQVARRGALRPLALMLASSAVIFIASASDSQAACVFTSGNDVGPGTFRQCVADAAAGETVESGLLPGDIVVLNSQIDVDKSLTIGGSVPVQLFWTTPALDLLGSQRTLIIASGTQIQTSGFSNNAINALGGSNTILLRGEILTNNGSSWGINAGGGRNVIVASGTIRTFGAGTIGIAAVGGDNSVTASGSIRSSGTAVQLAGGNSRATISGSIETTDNNSAGVSANTGQNLIDVSGSIVVKGPVAAGIRVSGTNNTINLSGSILAEATGATGIELQSGTGNRLTATGSIQTLADFGYGIYAVGGGSTSAIVAGNITTAGNNASGIFTFFSNSNVFDIAGSVSTSGANSRAIWSNSSDGNLFILSGSLSASGSQAVLFQGGTNNRLELRPGFAINGQVNLGNQTLTFGGTGAASFDLALVGSQYVGVGLFDKRGSSTWTLTGADFFTPISVLEGSLLLDAATAGPMTVNGGILGGNGSVSTLAVSNGGVVSPGLMPGSVGAIATSTGLSFAPGSTYRVDTTSTAVDRIVQAGGANNLSGGFVDVNLAGGIPNGPQSIVSAIAGLTGSRFAGVADNSIFFESMLTYGANDVFLNVVPITGRIPGLDDNQAAAASAIQAAIANGQSLPSVFITIDANGLTKAGGPISTASVSAGLDAASQFISQISDPDAPEATGDASTAYAPLAYSAEPANLSSAGALAALGAEVPASSDAANAALAMSAKHSADAVDMAIATRWKTWGAVYGNAGRIRGNATVGSADLTATNWGIATGFDRRLGNGRLGLTLGGAGSSFSLANGLGSGQAGIFNAGVYGSMDFGSAYLSAALAYGWNNVRTTRAVAGDTLTANFNAHTFGGRAEAGYRFGSIVPYAAMQGASYFLPAYTETSALNGPFALAYGRQTESALRTELGLRLEHSIPMSSSTIKLSGRAAWAYNAINARAVTAAFAALPGQSFTINGARPDRNATLLDLGIDAAFASGLSAKLSFNGEFSRNVTVYGASARLSFKW